MTEGFWGEKIQWYESKNTGVKIKQMPGSIRSGILIRKQSGTTTAEETPEGFLCSRLDHDHEKKKIC